MANPNPEIWGAPETWIPAPYASGATDTTAEQLKFSTPKCADFGTNDANKTNLKGGITSGRITENEPIDLTICPCGQDETISAFGSIAIFNENGDLSITPRIVQRDRPVNWCFSDLLTDTLSVPDTFMIYRDYNYSFNRGMRFDQWSPNAVNTDGYNNNYYLSPYVFYYMRSILLSIEVQCLTAESSDDFSTAWRTLDDWKNNYNTQKICGLRCINHPVNSYDSNNEILSYFPDGDILQYRYTGKIVLLDSIPNINNNGVLKDTTFYSFLNLRDRGRYSYIFTYSGRTPASRSICVLPAWDKFEGQELVKVTNSNGAVYYYRIPYSETNYETILKMIACFGCYFTPSDKISFNYAMTDNDLYLPIIDDNGIAHGEYTHGADNLNNDLYDLNSIRDKNYDPSKQVDPNTYSDTTNWNTVNFQNTFCKRYELTAAQVGQLAAELWAAQASKPADIDYHNFAIDEYLTNNPIDTIVSLKYFPCDVETAANPAIVHLGKYQTQIAANAISHTVKVIDFDPIDVFPHFGDYRDYEPYTTLQMYIPFCGTVSIPTAEAMGKWISVKLCIDINTGACVGFVIVSNSGSGGICVATATGTASIDIPVSGLQSANLSQAIFNATAQWTQTQISNAKISSGLLSHAGGLLGNISKGLSKQGGLSPTSLLGALKGGPIGSVGLLDRLDPVKAYWSGYESEIESSKADYNLTHVEIPMRLIGSTSPALSSVIESSCRLIIYRPITDEGALSHYADTVGFATVSSGTVSEYSGYTEGTIDVSGINASASEKSEIQRLFASGVYL